MKNILSITISALFILTMFNACEQQYIDPITSVDPGTDESAPVITVITPQDGSQVNSASDMSEVIFEFEIADDIELGSVTITLNGEELEAYSEFKDYRKLIVKSPYELGLGDYTIVIKADDINGKSTTETINFEKINTIRELMNQAIFHLDFNEDFVDNVSEVAATVVGEPSLVAQGVDGGSYQGSEDSYLTFPGAGLQSDVLSASFYLNINGTPDRAGILVMGPEDTDNANFPDVQNDRTSGFRFFRENGAGLQQFKLNAGNGTADSWFDGGAAARVDPATTEWVHFAFTISETQSTVYINGEIVRQGDFGGIDWTGCNLLSIMSGAPRFNEWNHKSDLSHMDELLIYDRVLTQEEVQLLGML